MLGFLCFNHLSLHLLRAKINWTLHMILFRIAVHLIAKLVFKHYHHWHYFNNNIRHVWNPFMCLLLTGLWYSLQTGPRVRTQHHVCRPTPAERQCPVICEPPAAGDCCGLRVLQTEDWEVWTVPWIVISFTDTFHTWKLCSWDAAEWAESLTHRGWCPSAGERWNGATVTSGGFVCSLCDVLLCSSGLVLTTLTITNTLSSQNGHPVILFRLKLAILAASAELLKALKYIFF